MSRYFSVTFLCATILNIKILHSSFINLLYTTQVLNFVLYYFAINHKKARYLTFKLLYNFKIMRIRHISTSRLLHCQSPKFEIYKVIIKLNIKITIKITAKLLVI